MAVYDILNIVEVLQLTRNIIWWLPYLHYYSAYHQHELFATINDGLLHKTCQTQAGSILGLKPHTPLASTTCDLFTVINLLV